MIRCLKMGNTWIMYIRYKDGREKMIELPSNYLTLILPQVSTLHAYTNGVAQTTYTIVPVNPYQQVTDINSGIHIICIEEILDITIEAAHEHRQDSQ